MSLQKGLIIRDGKAIDADWEWRMVIDEVPIAVTPTTFTSTLQAGGLLPLGAYFYKVVAVGLNRESIATVETTQIAAGGNRTIDLNWVAQTYVKEYHVYRGTVTGVYDGYFRTFTNSFSDDGTSVMVTNDSIVPPATNPVAGVALGAGYVGNGDRNVIFYDEMPQVNSLYVAEVNNGIDLIPEKRVLYFSSSIYTSSTSINLNDVLIPANWNTPGSDAGGLEAVSKIQDWAIIP